MSRLREVKEKVAKQPNLKVIIHAFGLSRGSSFERHGMTPRAMGGRWKEVTWLGTIYGCLYVHFESILGFTRNEQMECLEAFRGNENGVKHTLNVISHVGTPGNFSK